MKKALWGLLALLVVGVAFLGLRYSHLRSAALRWDGPVEEILSEKFEKNAGTAEMEFSSRLDAPVAAVFRAFTEPERIQQFSDIVRYAKLLRDEGNRKVVELEVVVLGQPQRFTLEFAFFPDQNPPRVAVKTVESQVADLSGEYRFTPSPDGTKTLVTYTAVSQDKVKLPVPLSLQKSASREVFVSTIRALKKGLAAQGESRAEGEG